MSEKKDTHTHTLTERDMAATDVCVEARPGCALVLVEPFILVTYGVRDPCVRLSEPGVDSEVPEVKTGVSSKTLFSLRQEEPVARCR